MRFAAVILALAIFAYAATTAYVGFLVARGIDNAKAQSVVTRVGSRLIGRDAVERLAIQRGHVPGWVVQSPAFWWTLRAYE